MTDLRKAAEMALEALETLWDILDDIDTASDMAKENDAWYRKRVEALQKKRWDTMITTDGYKLKDGPVEALRQALAQAEQRWHCTCGDPTLLGYVHFRTRPCIYYTAPPKREWVGLTENEIEEIARWADKNAAPWYLEYAKGIEAKLKEKNT